MLDCQGSQPNVDKPEHMPRVRDEKSFQAKREQILAIATQCFIESGFHGTGMAKICKAAKMSAGALYRYFPSKESMIEAIVEQDRIETVFFVERLKQAENKAIGLAELMVEAVYLYAEDRSYCQLWIEIAAEMSRNPVAAKLVSTAETELLTELTALVKQGQLAGDIDSTLMPDITAQLLLTMTYGFLGQFSIQPDVVDTKAISQHARRAVLNLLLP